MTENWNDIKWIFEPDGSLRDIYVQDVTLSDWGELIDFLNLNFDIKFGEDKKNQIDKEYVFRFLKDETGEMEIKVLSIHFNGVRFNGYFFLSEQIEFDIDPKAIKTIDDFRTIVEFMTSVSKTLKNQVTLTEENSPEFPLIKIDFDKGVNKILTEKEANKILRRQNSFSTKMTSFKSRFMMRFFPRTFKEKLLKSANEPYRATGKEKNLW